MKDEKLTDMLTGIHTKLDQLVIKSPEEVGRELLNIGDDVNDAKARFKKVTAPSFGFILFCAFFGGFLTIVILSATAIVMDDGDDFPEYNPHPDRPYIGNVAATNSEYINTFNETFIGFVTHINISNCTDDALITLKNREQEITLNEYWITWVDEEWFEEQYNVDFYRLPDHFIGYNGTYQFSTYQFSNPDDLDDWHIIHTENGILRCMYYSPEDINKWYYYNNTYHGGVNVEYNNHTFTIVKTGEEIEYEVIL